MRNKGFNRSLQSLSGVLLMLQAAHELFGMGRENIDLTFGGVTIGTAVVATLVGGWALDWVGSSIKNAMLLNGRSSLLKMQCCSMVHLLH